MDLLLIGAGVACVLAAVAGGGLKAAGFEIPVLHNRVQYLLFALIGLALFVLGLYVHYETSTLPGSLGGITEPLVSPTATTPTPSPEQVTVSVSAVTDWTDTGVDVQRGNPLRIKASGSWRDGKTLTGPSGAQKPWPDNFLNLADIGVCNSCARTPTPYQDALVAYIGSSPPKRGSYTSRSVLPEAMKVFYVGANYSSPSVQETGRLWLNMNGDAYSNNWITNSGQVTAIITTK